MLHETVKYVFGWIFTIVLTLILWTMFLLMQPNMYHTMDSALSAEWNKDTGNNGTLVNTYKEQVWEDDTFNDTYIAYKETT